MPLTGLHSSKLAQGPALLEATALYKPGLPSSLPRATGALQKWERPFPPFLYQPFATLIPPVLDRGWGRTSLILPPYLPICSQDGQFAVCYILSFPSPVSCPQLHSLHLCLYSCSANRFSSNFTSIFITFCSLLHSHLCWPALSFDHPVS